MTLIFCTHKFSYIKGIKILFLQTEITIIPKGILKIYKIKYLLVKQLTYLTLKYNDFKIPMTPSPLINQTNIFIVLKQFYIKEF